MGTRTNRRVHRGGHGGPPHKKGCACLRCRAMIPNPTILPGRSRLTPDASVRGMTRVALVLVALLVVGCKKRGEPAPQPVVAVAVSPAPAPPSKPHDAIARTEFNRWAVRLNLPLYWIADANDNKSVDP